MSQTCNCPIAGDLRLCEHRAGSQQAAGGVGAPWAAGYRRVRSFTCPGDVTACVSPPSVQNDHFRVLSAAPARSAPVVRIGGSVRGHAKTQVALGDGLPVSFRPRLAELTAAS